MKLYEISNELAAILGDADDEISDDVAERLSSLELALETKVENILQARQGILADAEAIKKESERLKARADSLTRKSEWLKGYVLSALQQTGVKKVSTVTFTATVANSPMSVKFDEGRDIPDEYRREEIKVTLDKKAVLEAFKSGKTLPEGVAVVQGVHLKIS